MPRRVVAGVHLFTDTDCNVYASGPFVVLHASQDGPLQLHLPERKRDPHRAEDNWHVFDALSGEPIGQGRKIVIPLKRGDSRVLRIE